MKQLPYIEDYIALMATDQLVWPPSEPIIKLARYDEPIVNSMLDQIQRGNGFTDRQAALAYKIVIKYRRQWASKGYEISHLIDSPQYRLPIRPIDRRCIIDVIDNLILIRFPYNQEQISEIRAAVNTVPGNLWFDRDRRCWASSLIEPRIKWAQSFGTKYSFEFGHEFDRILQSVLSQEDYSIELRYNGNSFVIQNAESSLIDYIELNGGFGLDNLINLVDLSGVCCYKINHDIFNLFPQQFKENVREFFVNREINVKYNRSVPDLSSVIEYAQLTLRWPMYVYESGSRVLRKELDKYFDSHDIVDKKLHPHDTLTGKVVYLDHWKSAADHMKLLVTSHALMIGNRRQQMLQCSDKIVYFTQQIGQDA